jgi:magnesium transporter
VIRVRRYLGTGEVDEQIDPQEISECLGRGGQLLWVDAEELEPDDVACLAEEFAVNHLAAEDLLESLPRPTLGRYGSHLLLAVRDCSGDRESFATREIDLVFGDGWLISVRKPGEDGAPPMPVETVVERFERLRGEQGLTDEGFLLYAFLDVVVERFFDAADLLQDRLEAIEEAIFSDDDASAPSNRSITKGLYQLRRDLVAFRRVVAPLREAIAPLLRREAVFLAEPALVHLRDVYDLVVRVTEQTETYRDLLNGALEAHLSIASNRMNLVMKRATSWGAILVTATLVAGIYGMNFRHMPELDWYVGYPFALGLMAAVTAVLYRNFKRRDWL